MDEETQKEFSFPEIVLGLTFTAVSDLVDVFSLLIAPLPVIGQVALFGSKISSFVVFVLIQGWLFFKGVNSPGQSASKWMTKLIFSGGSTMDMSGIPFGQTMSLALVIYLSNHPKAAGVVGTVAAAALTGGAGAGAAAGGAARAGAAAEGAAARGGVVGARATTAIGEARGVATEASSALESGAFSGRTISEEALGVRKGDIEQVMDVMKKMPEPEARREEGDEEEKYRLAA